MTRKTWRQSVLQYATMMLGAAILAFGLYNIHNRNQITEGGVLGMTLLLQHWLGISPGIAGPILDITCYLLGLKFLGKQFFKNALVASLSFALFYNIFERIGYLLPDLSHQPLISAILGGIFVGVGVGLVVRQGGASGGDDALALVISKMTHWRISRAYLLTDLVVLLLSLSYIPFVNILFSLLTVTLSSFLIDIIQHLGRHKDTLVRPV